MVLDVKQLFHRLGVRPLALRLLCWVLLYSVVLSLAATGAQMYGVLSEVSSFRQFYDEVLGQALRNLWFQSAVVMLGTLGMLLIVRITLFRHLETMADYAARLNLDALVEPLTLRRKAPSRPDELSELEHALNRMRLQILEDTHSLRQDNQKSRNERDEAIRANHAKNQFLASVSHELRIPLQSVLGYASLLHDTPLDQEQGEYVNTLLGASENLSAILNDLLDISAIEAGKMELDEVPLDLREILNDLIYMLGNRARDKGLALEVRIDEDLPWALVGDPVRIRQLMLNLLSNAIKFTDSGHVLVAAEVLGRQDGKVRLRLAVEDTGVGISPENIPLVYEPYVQLGQEVYRQPSGAGLGLTICRQLVELMGGSLELHSRPGEGTTFWAELTLPVITNGSARIRPDSRMIQNKRLLVVDSYELSRKITLEMLSRHEVHIDAVRTAGEALSYLRQTSEAGVPYHALILDGFVPDMDSDLLCRQIRNSRDWAGVRLLILSSNPQRGDAEHFREAGADAFLSKSLRESYLTPMLNQLFTDAGHQERRFLTRFSLPSYNPRAPAVPDGRKLTGDPLQVLLVEDNPVNRTLTRRLLEKLGCQVMTANDGEAAEAIYPRHAFDVVFMDCMMPRVDGFEATRRLRRWERDNGKHPVPVVALTASAMEQDEEKCRAAGMDSFLAKPVNLEMLRAVLEQYAKAPAGSEL